MDLFFVFVNCYYTFYDYTVKFAETEEMIEIGEEIEIGTGKGTEKG